MNSTYYDVARSYHQYEREDQVERTQNDYLRSIEVTHSLMEEIEQFLFG